VLKRSPPIRVLVVDDSALMRKLLVNILEQVEDIQVVGTAMDGVFALDKAEHLRPDVVTLDLEMPRMDGLAALERIVVQFGLPVLLVSAHTAKGAKATFEGLAAGAVDFVTKPDHILSTPLESLGSELVRKIRMAAGVRVRNLTRLRIRSRSHSRITEPKESKSRVGVEHIVAIGVSTGGPNALSYLLPQIRPDIEASLLIVQHMPEGFTAPFAGRLNELASVEVREAADGDELLPGRALIAAGGRHLEVKREKTEAVAVLTTAPSVQGLRPSADVLFNSVAKAIGRRAVGLIMTGMGEDGARGLRAIREGGGHTLAQDRESSVIYGMPQAAIDRRAVDKVLPLSEIGQYLNTLEFGHGDRHEEKKHAVGN